VRWTQETHLSGNLVRFNADKVHSVVKVHGPELSFLDHSVVEFALEIHHQVEHVVVGLSWEKDLPSVELVQRAADRPHVKRIIIGQAKNLRDRLVWVAGQHI
jgi:hypothetical protein